MSAAWEGQDRRQKKSDSDGIYRRSDRSGYWISWIDETGKRRRRKVQVSSMMQARAARAAELIRVEQSRTLGFAPPSEDSFASLADRFLKHQQRRLTPKAFQREAGIIRKHLKPFFAGKVAAVRRVDVERYVTHRCGRVATDSVIKELNVLKHLFRLTVEWGRIPTSPARGVKPPKAAPGRVRYLQPQELRHLLEACPLWLRPIVALAVATGMRRGEVLAVRWLDVDRRQSRILLPQTKNNEGRAVYLNRLALDVIESLNQGGPTDLLFPGITGNQVTMAFRRACVTAGIADFRYHDLRHTAASWLRMSGADIHTVACILGHKDLRMAARYQHLSPAFLADAVMRLDSALEREQVQNLALASPQRHR